MIVTKYFFLLLVLFAPYQIWGCEDSLLGPIDSTFHIVPNITLSDLKNPEKRKLKIEEIRDFYKMKSDVLKKRLFQKSLKPYDFAIIGGGPASLAFVAGVKKSNPEAKIIILEETSTLNPTFEWPGDAVVFNTSVMVFDDEIINNHIFPDHDFQLSDFEEFASHKQYHPNGTQISQLAWTYLSKLDPELILNFSVEKIHRASNGNYQIHTRNLPPIKATKVVIATGQGRAQLHGIEVQNSQIQLEKALNTQQPFFEDLGIETYLQALAYIHSHQLRPDKYIGKKVAIVGSGDAGIGLLEVLTGLTTPSLGYSINPDRSRPSELAIYGVHATPPNLKTFKENTTPRYASIKGVASLFVQPGYPLPSSTYDLRKEIGKSLFFEANKVAKIERTEKGSFTLVDSDGNSREFDHVILANGYIRNLTSMLTMIPSSAWDFEYEHLPSFLETINETIFIQGGSYWPNKVDVSAEPLHFPNARTALKIKNENIYLIANAAGAKLLVPDSEAKDGTQKDINEFGDQPRSSSFTKYSLQHMLPRAYAAGAKIAKELE
jgi:thioredoxin reductase